MTQIQPGQSDSICHWFQQFPYPNCKQINSLSSLRTGVAIAEVILDLLPQNYHHLFLSNIQIYNTDSHQSILNLKSILTTLKIYLKGKQQLNANILDFTPEGLYFDHHMMQKFVFTILMHLSEIQNKKQMKQMYQEEMNQIANLSSIIMTNIDKFQTIQKQSKINKSIQKQNKINKSIQKNKKKNESKTKIKKEIIQIKHQEQKIQQIQIIPVQSKAIKKKKQYLVNSIDIHNCQKWINCELGYQYSLKKSKKIQRQIQNPLLNGSLLGSIITRLQLGKLTINKQPKNKQQIIKNITQIANCIIRRGIEAGRKFFIFDSSYQTYLGIICLKNKHKNKKQSNRENKENKSINK